VARRHAAADAEPLCQPKTSTVATIPELRTELLAMADKMENREPAMANRLREIVQELHRRPAVRKTPPKNRPMDPRIKRNIRKFASQFPNMSYQEIAALFRVNVGRVSEAVAGRRT
jgi:hypothetical protein